MLKQIGREVSLLCARRYTVGRKMYYQARLDLIGGSFDVLGLIERLLFECRVRKSLDLNL